MRSAHATTSFFALAIANSLFYLRVGGVCVCPDRVVPGRDAVLGPSQPPDLCARAKTKRRRRAHAATSPEALAHTHRCKRCWSSISLALLLLLLVFPRPDMPTREDAVQNWLTARDPYIPPSICCPRCTIVDNCGCRSLKVFFRSVLKTDLWRRSVWKNRISVVLVNGASAFFCRLMILLPERMR